MIKIQQKDFNIDKEIANIKSLHLNVGAVTAFIGYVRDINNAKKVNSIELEANLSIISSLDLSSLE